MSESLPVELNAGSVHAIDAPATFTAGGPFHLELSNAGGAVHVHIHLGEDLSRGVRVREVNHYVESGETVRVPVGTVSADSDVTGHLEVVTGYGAERERIEVTVAADPRAESRRDRPSGDAPGNTRTGGDDPGVARTGGGSDTDPDARTVDTSASDASTGHSMEQSATGMGVRGLTNRSLPGVSLPAVTTREGLAFAVLAAVTVAIGVAVVVTVGEPVLSLVVAAVVLAAVAAAGWLLLG